MYIENRRLKSIANLFPYFLLIIAGLGLSLALVMRRIDLIVISLVMVIPLTLGAVVIIYSRNSEADGLELPAFLSRVHFSDLFLTNALIAIISLIILILDSTRPAAYFILIALFSGVLFLQIVAKRPQWTDYLIVLEIVFLSLSLVWGATLKYPLYFSDSDTLIHLYLIDTIIRTNHIQTAELTYQFYPLYHIFNALGMEVTGLSVRTALFILMGIAWQAAILGGYLIFRKLTDSSRFAAIACLLLATSSQLIFYGSYPIARALAFVFFIGWIYLVVSKARLDLGYLTLSVIIMVAMIMTHHINMLLVIPMLLLVYICQIIVNRSHQDQPFEPLFIYLFAIGCLAYFIWTASTMTSQTLPGAIRSIINSEFAVSNNPTEGYGYSTILGVIYYSFALLMSFLGMRFFLTHLKPGETTRLIGGFLLGGFILLVFYVPGPLDLLPVSANLMSSRLNLLVSPFIAPLMALGVYFLLNLKISPRFDLGRRWHWPMFTAVLVGTMTFFSTISTGNSLDNTSFPHTSNMKTPYFTEAELSSYRFLNDKGIYSVPLYADYQTMRNEFMLFSFTRHILTGGDISYIHNGYLALRIGELEHKKALTLSADSYGVTSFRYSLDSYKTGLGSTDNLGSKDRIYSDGSVQIFWIQEPVNPES